MQDPLKLADEIERQALDPDRTTVEVPDAVADVIVAALRLAAASLDEPKLAEFLDAKAAFRAAVSK